MRFLAPILVAALAAALLAVMVSQGQGAAGVPETSPTTFFSATSPLPPGSTTTSAHLPRPSEPSTTRTTTEPTAPRPLPSPSTTIPVEASPPTTAKKGSSPTTTAPGPTPTTIQARYSSDYESQIFGKINALRSGNGLSSLTRSGSLDAEARRWAKSMAASGKLAHSNISRLIPPWGAAAENLGAGGSVDSVFSLLAASGSHLDNMLGNYSHVAVGVWVDSGGKLWTVNLFAR